MKIIYLLLFLSTLSFCSCESKRDTSDLAGFWQMMAWEGPNGEVKATKHDQIFYSVQLNVMKLHQLKDGYDNYFLTYYNHKGDSLIIYHAVKFVNDSIVSLKDLAKYGVPENGRFHVDALEDDKLILSAPETGTLSFRKY